MKLTRIEAIQQAAAFIDETITPKIVNTGRSNYNDQKTDPAEARWKLIRDTAEFILKDNSEPNNVDWYPSVKTKLTDELTRMKSNGEDPDEIIGFQKAITFLTNLAL